MSDKLTDFRQLNVWQKSHKLVLNIYELTKKYPKDEKGELSSRMRHTAADIPIRIAQGFMRRSPKDKTFAYKGTLESIEALKYMVILSRDLEYAKNVDTLIENIEEVGRMLTGLVRSVRSEGPPRQEKDWS
ncbi:four helix bundle protein [bacterium]|nr:four helix bundle protein [bacterium]